MSVSSSVKVRTRDQYPFEVIFITKPNTTFDNVISTDNTIATTISTLPVNTPSREFYVADSILTGAIEMLYVFTISVNQLTEMFGLLLRGF